MSHPTAIIGGLLLATLSWPALAQSPAAPAGPYPTRSVRMVVSFAAGGVSDIMSRVLAQKMSEFLGQPIVVENRAGAGGSIGTDFVAKASPDGYTILSTSPTQMAIAPNLVKSVTYDPIKDFTAIGGVALAPNILSINTTLPIRNLMELVAYAKANPGKLSFGSSGVGSVGHLSGEVLRLSTGVEMVHVPYKSASAAYPDMLAGTVSMVFDTLPSAIGHVQSGKARAIGLMSDRRSTLLPEVPTFAEAGFPEATLRFWFAIHGPANMPPAVVQKLNEALNKSLAAADLRERFASLGATPLPTTPQEAMEITRVSLEQITRTIKSGGIKAE